MQFRQSSNDFPLTVRLGEKTPSWGLSRWGGKGLRFAPFDDEGFILRGSKQRLVYKGRRRSHRFTILGDNVFEYDCILEKEQENNIITLAIEGAGNFDFFRQPDFVPDPFLKGSYAVYKKETLVGEGTGKLCHIHRPLIIDARGQRCWGDLSIVGNCLCITIPESWLAEAKYPVIVDPTIGTTAIGSQTTGPDPNNQYYDRPWLDGEYSMNKYLVPQNGNGLCTAYVYCYNTETEDYIIPCLYTNVNNKPYMRISQNEKSVRVTVWPPSYPIGWKSNTFYLNENIADGEYVWYGFYGGYFTTRFDYGGDCYKGWFNYDSYPDYEDEGEAPPYMNLSQWDAYCTIKWSWYFDYTAVTSQNYFRALTQGVGLSDNQKFITDYKRNPTETVQANSTVNRLQTIYRKVQEAVQGLDNNSYSFLFFRSVKDTATATVTILHLGAFFRRILDNAIAESEVKPGRIYFLKLTDTVQAAGAVLRGLLLFVRIVTGLFVKDYILRRFLIAREELILKSCITREITLESKIN